MLKALTSRLGDRAQASLAADPDKEYIAKLRAKRLVQLGAHDDDWWTVGSALEGTQIFGATGSGKTSASGRTLALAFLEQGWGGLVLTAKNDDLDNWRRWAGETGREGSLVVLEPGNGRQFNFLDYEMNHVPHGTPLTHDIVSLLMHAMSETSERASNEPFWEDALRQLLTATFDLVHMAGTPVTMRTMAEVVRSAPQSSEETSSPAWQDKSTCWKLLLKAQELVPEGPRQRDFEEAVAYWTQEFPALAARTRSIVVTSFMSKAASLLRSPLREVLGQEAGGTQATPEDTFAGKILVVNLPVKVYGEVGRLAQRIVKIVWQRATERRRVKAGTLPQFLWADEAQAFVTAEDAQFQQTARGALAATVYLTQNLPNYYAMVSGKDRWASTESLLGNLNTKIFHANGDPTTNAWAERLIGQTFVFRKGRGLSASGDPSSHASFNMNESEVVDHVVRAREFTTLKKAGGPDRLADAIVFEGGRVWTQSGENFIRTAFWQGP